MLIAIDIDEVLADTLNHFIFLYNQKFKTSFKRDDFYTFDWWEVLGLEKDRFKAIYEKMVAQGFFQNIQTIKGAQDGVKELQKDYSLAIVTGRPKSMTEITKAWLAKNFAGSFSQFYFTKEVILGPNKKPKHDICQQIGAKVILEDEFEFAEDCAQGHIQVLLFDNPWNRAFKMPSYMIRVYSWEDILDKINSFSKNK